MEDKDFKIHSRWIPLPLQLLFTHLGVPIILALSQETWAVWSIIAYTATMQIFTYLLVNLESQKINRMYGVMRLAGFPIPHGCRPFMDLPRGEKLELKKLTWWWLLGSFLVAANVGIIGVILKAAGVT